MTTQLPAIPGSRPSTGTFLAKVRAAKGARPPAVRTGADLISAAIAGGRPRLLLAVDATASRSTAWNAAKQTTDVLLTAVPGGLDVALAVHGGGTVHTFTPFVSDAAVIRDRAAGVTCSAGETRLVTILEEARTHSRLKVVVYIGDAFEEDEGALMQIADALRLLGTKVIVLHDAAGGADSRSGQVFAELADRTRGAVLPFDPSSLDRLRELLEAVAVLAVGGVKLLEARAKQLPGARLLLANLSRKCP